MFARYHSFPLLSNNLSKIYYSLAITPFIIVPSQYFNQLPPIAMVKSSSTIVDSFVPA